MDMPVYLSWDMFTVVFVDTGYLKYNIVVSVPD